MDPEPREPTPAGRSTDDLAERHQRCHELDQRVKAGLRAGRAAMWMTAEALYEFDRHSGWSTLGYGTRADWLADPEVGMTERSFQRLVRVWREAVIRRELEPPALARLDLSKVEIVLAAVDDGLVKLPDALADAEALGWRELRRKYARPAPSRALPSPDRPARDHAARPDPGALPTAPGPAAAARRTAVPDPRLASSQPPEDETTRQLERWLAFYNEVRQAAATGQPLPRVNARVIVPGLDALAHLLEAAGVHGIDRLMP